MWQSALRNFMQFILLEPGEVYGKKYFFELSTHFQFNHSDSFILSRQVLCWPCFDRFSSYGFDFLLFNYMLLSA